MAAFKIYKETALPGTPANNAIYIVAPAAKPDYVEIYVTSSAGVVKRVIDEDDVQALIDASLAGMNSIRVVADIAARNALSLTTDSMVLVKDASADVTVDSGAALYVWEQALTTYSKIAEYESLDFTIDWSDVQNRPSSSAANIDDAVAKRHTHANSTELAKITEDGSGNLLYDGALPATKWDSTSW